jgi:hypothetical protein
MLSLRSGLIWEPSKSQFAQTSGTEADHLQSHLQASRTDIDACVHPTAMQDMRSCAICQFPRVGTRGSKNGSHRDRTSSSSSRNGAKISHMTPPTRSQQDPSGKRVGQCDIGEAACGGTKCAGKICRQSSEVAVLRCNPLLCLQCVFSLLVQLEVGGLAGSFFFFLQQQ